MRTTILSEADFWTIHDPEILNDSFARIVAVVLDTRKDRLPEDNPSARHDCQAIADEFIERTNEILADSPFRYEPRKGVTYEFDHEPNADDIERANQELSDTYEARIVDLFWGLVPKHAR